MATAHIDIAKVAKKQQMTLASAMPAQHSTLKRLAYEAIMNKELTWAYDDVKKTRTLKIPSCSPQNTANRIGAQVAPHFLTAATAMMQAIQNFKSGVKQQYPSSITPLDNIFRFWILVEQHINIGVPTPKDLGCRQDPLRKVRKPSTPRDGSWTSQTFKRFGS
ncbi:uncharacterized protein PGTG_17640 [Puccinia graminis f. sp. tritici CRL 75-36-700-3]|uniref:Uncharacterized protein n=1 Tax=Puccinia graminis f. sp. tritici (strain CRL 75-36-700-3 / race SCCL) TaxID=418459 RepID=E3L4W1_PUCGT|nr:uncharacterized protein PGTG_17640 [Puccinia graminis f. sp. tritici CRL 75-36-700-3]EFP91586.1 hypothetical protein PGTG_17640 [Puccinia graminis f. sp. tritici CRL 75-36-700-3]